MTPQTEYALKIDISDADKLSDIAQIEVILKTNSTDISAANSMTDKATYLWTPSGEWQFNGPANSTWSINATASSRPATLGGTSGIWWLHFTPGKVARESAAWDIYVEVTDKADAAVNNTKCNYAMMWYGEISLIDAPYSFGDISLNSENIAIVDTDNAVNVTVIANGNYKLKSKSGDRVNETYAAPAVLEWNGTLEAWDMPLKNDANNAVGSFILIRISFL